MNPIDTTRLSPWLEQAWLERYLDRRLSDQETAWFETYAMGRADLLAMIEADADLRDAVHAAPASAFVPLPARVPPRRRSTAWAIAASLVIGLGAGVAGMRAITPSAPDLVASPVRIVYDTMRGEAVPPRVEHADSASPYALVEVAVPGDAVEIALVREGDAPRPLTLSPDGFASFLIKRSLISNASPLRLRFRRSNESAAQEIMLRPLPL